jgi:hypothetical protein
MLRRLSARRGQPHNAVSPERFEARFAERLAEWDANDPLAQQAPVRGGPLAAHRAILFPAKARPCSIRHAEPPAPAYSRPDADQR